MTLPNGDTVSGHFNGEWSKEIKINGTFNKATSPLNESTRNKDKKFNIPWYCQ